jgi:cell fate regulator YaaT (PSP1 superfamily)
MSLINAYYNFDRSLLYFQFVSDERVDFRDLAKELASIYKTRIELRQIGVRDKAKYIGGCGPCGKELCCRQFLKDFESVSINNVKNQNLSLNPSKINGVCGRLLCCMKYEDECYKELRKDMPTIGKMVETDQGKVKVISIDILKQTYRVDLGDKGIIECEVNGSNK